MRKQHTDKGMKITNIEGEGVPKKDVAKTMKPLSKKDPTMMQDLKKMQSGLNKTPQEKMLKLKPSQGKIGLPRAGVIPKKMWRGTGRNG